MENNIFGTDGIRTTVGKEPFTVQGLTRIADAVGRWSQEKYGNNVSMLLAHDTRVSASFVKATLASRLLLYPMTIIDAQVLTTPAVCKLLQQGSYDCSIIVSASHNPYSDNGIKIVGSHGKLLLEDELKISQYFYESSNVAGYTSLGSMMFLYDAPQQYIQLLENYFAPNFLQGKKIVLDCAHGAAYHVAPEIFKRLGAQVIVIGNQPNGYNINCDCGSLHTRYVQEVVVDCHADAGFSFDGDADRVIAINHKGEVKNGDDILAILLHNRYYTHAHAIVGTTMTNKGFEAYLQTLRKNLIRAQVGDKYVAAQMQENKLLLGGEPSGHIIAADYLTTGDGIFTALRVMETLQQTGNWAMDTFVKFPQIIINVPVCNKKDLGHAELRDIITYYQSQLHAGRLCVRYSGTEPLLRIMIEDSDLKHAELIGESVSKKLKQLLT